MAIKVIREVNRSEGLLPGTGVTAIIAGQPLTLESATTVQPYNNAAGLDIPFGIAAETTTQEPIAPLSGQTAGQGYDYTDFARGGLVSAFINGSVLQLYNDGRGSPYDATQTYVLNRPVYASATGFVTSLSTTTGANPVLIGVVEGFDVATSPTYLIVKFTI